MSEFRHCHHVFEDGRTCGSAAVTGRDYCYHYMRDRGNRIRIFRARAENRQVHLDLPPLDNLCAVHSVATQIVQAVAAHVIDFKHANAILSYLRLIAQTLKSAGTPAWHNNAYQNEETTSYDSFETEFGLPENYDPSTPPEAAFPGSEISHGAILSEGKTAFSAMQAGGAPPFSPVFGERVGTDNRQPIGGPQLPSVGNCGKAGAPPLSAASMEDKLVSETDNPIRFGPEQPISPEWLELRDIRNTQGDEAEQLRFKQLERNRTRRQLRINRTRYKDLAQNLNVKWAAEQLAERKLAEKLKEAGIPPIEPEPKDFDTRVAEEMKKVQADYAEIDTYLAGKEVKIA